MVFASSPNLSSGSNVYTHQLSGDSNLRTSQGDRNNSWYYVGRQVSDIEIELTGRCSTDGLLW